MVAILFFGLDFMLQRFSLELNSFSHDVPSKFYVQMCSYPSQVSRSIGDAYLKRPEFALDPSFPRFHLPQPLQRPVLRADPSIVTRQISRDDKFLIFASDGLWEYLTNQEAVEIVHNNPRTVRFYFSHYFKLQSLV